MTATAQHYSVFETTAGFCAIAWSDAGVTRFQLPSHTAAVAERLLLRSVPQAVQAMPPAQIADVVTAAKRYFEGDRIDFSPVVLDIDGQDPFFTRIYETLRKVEWGQTTTYGTLAKELGAGPEAARDVGQAMAKNPVPLIIPCHRILAPAARSAAFQRPAARQPKPACLNLRASALNRHHLRSRALVSERESADKSFRTRATWRKSAATFLSFVCT
ncbi:methylated-DNA-[protein]-cysteine S-methyltransferase [Pseudorhodoplanes sinuspersici]|nr:methylated-DNA-[protein]-cysteine S-methyltransferase [Pseudorhodoplanes sinuspersici]